MTYKFIYRMFIYRISQTSAIALVKSLVVSGVAVFLPSLFANHVFAEIVTAQAPTQIQPKTQPSSPIAKVVAVKWMENFSDGQFRPEVFVSRGDLAQIMVRVFRLDRRQGLPSEDISIADVPRSHPRYQEIQTVLKSNIMRGYRDNLFFPNQQVTRAEAIAIFAQAYGVFQFPDETVNEFLSKYPDQNSIPSWARRAIATVIAEGFLNPDSDGKLRPLKPMTRGEMALLLSRYLERNQRQPETPEVPGARELPGNPR